MSQTAKERVLPRVTASLSPQLAQTACKFLLKTKHESYLTVTRQFSLLFHAI